MTDVPGRLTDEELAEIEARADAATSGPWDDAEMRRWPGRWDVWDREGRKCIAEVLWERDAEFIAAARSDVPRLLAAVRGQGEALQRRTEALRTLIAQVDDALLHIAEERSTLTGGAVLALRATAANARRALDGPVR